MPRKFQQKLPEIEILRARAHRCRQLADGAGDMAFAIKLHAISTEYEGEAKRIRKLRRLDRAFDRTEQQS